MWFKLTEIKEAIDGTPIPAATASPALHQKLVALMRVYNQGAQVFNKQCVPLGWAPLPLYTLGPDTVFPGFKGWDYFYLR